MIDCRFCRALRLASDCSCLSLAMRLSRFLCANPRLPASPRSARAPTWAMPRLPHWAPAPGARSRGRQTACHSFRTWAERPNAGPHVGGKKQTKHEPSFSGEKTKSLRSRVFLFWPPWAERPLVGGPARRLQPQRSDTHEGGLRAFLPIPHNKWVGLSPLPPLSPSPPALPKYDVSW
jgi:hypothetical protein